MGRKILSLLLIFTCVFLPGCGQLPVSQTDSTGTWSTGETTGTTVTTEVTETYEAHTEAATQATESQPEPIPHSQDPWTPICQEFINLWASPACDTVMAEIPVGETLYLEKWQGKCAFVTYKNQQGYVHANYIQPADPDYFAKNLSVIIPTSLYSYEQMLADMEKLQMQYPGLVGMEKIGDSELGRKIPALILGDPDAKYHVLIQGAMHGREHFTAWLAMALADHTLLQGQLSDDICYHIIPMSNPDGVEISQSGQLDSQQDAIYQQDLANGYTTASAAAYAQQWKANALGIDLNRNFSAGWEQSLERPVPSSEKHRGAEPFSAAESRALRDYTLQYEFDATISIHSHGSVLYYRYGSKEPVNQLSYSLALAVRQETGYIPTSYDNTTGAGYKDWAMDELGIPSLTVEIGSYTTPLAQRDIYNTFHRCKALLPAIYQWLTQH